MKILIHTIFPHIRPTGIIILHNIQTQVLLENTTFILHKIVRIAGIIRVAGIIRGRGLYEDIWQIIILFAYVALALKKMHYHSVQESI